MVTILVPNEKRKDKKLGPLKTSKMKSFATIVNGF